MTYLVMGTREKHYRVETHAELTAWVDDEIETMADGWLPLASELEPDGSMRVIYGRLPDGLGHGPPDLASVPVGRDVRSDVERAVISLVILGMIVAGALTALGLSARAM